MPDLNKYRLRLLSALIAYQLAPTEELRECILRLEQIIEVMQCQTI